MRFYIVRHGTASHLLDDLNQRVNRDKFLTILNEWEESTLTPLGEEEIRKQAELLKDKYHYLYFSPVKRTQQTAQAFLKHMSEAHAKELPELIEIFIQPPRVPKYKKLKLKHWIALCVIRSLYTLKIGLYIKQARHILNSIIKTHNDVLIISHQARIITIVIYCWLSPSWKVIMTDFSPAGVTIIEKR
jgi:broad specificity phosphatase PhoE